MSRTIDYTAGPTQPITRLLGELHRGSREALDALVPLVYDELTALARRHRQRWHGDYTLGTTVLVHEAYLKLAQQDRVMARDRAHFFALASRVMRHILCNYARDRHAAKRGGGIELLDIAAAGAVGGGDAAADEHADRLLALNAALARLEQLHPRRSRVVECRFFGGLTVEETAAALHISASTVKRDWAAAEDWLRRELASTPGDTAGFEAHAAFAAAVRPLLHALDSTLPEPLQPGERVAHYEIVAPLGRGGMGVVYRAHDARLGRDVALKFLPAHMAGHAAARERLIVEARAASALDHPNICTVYDIGTLADGRTFLALACYDGDTLRRRLTDAPLPLDDIIAIARQIAQALAAAHRRGIVHRDITPSNIMITLDGTVKILDFGIATVRDAVAGAAAGTAGTIAYMSPEHTRGESLDGRADLWSLGVVLHEMLTGTRPFTGEDDTQLIDAIRTQPAALLEPARDGVPPMLLHVIAKCLQKQRAARYSDADGLLADLRAVELSLRAERRQIPPGGTDNGEAHTLYLKGRYFWNKRDAASLRQARACFEQALDLDPVYAQAWTGLADTFCVLGSSMHMQPEEAYPRARAAAERALLLDGELADAHASLATALADYYWDWAAASLHYRRALALQPGHATARLWYAGFLRDLGEFDAALAQVDAARELDPLALPIRAAQGITLYLARRHAEAVAVFRTLLEISPSFTYAHFLVALPLAQQGAQEEALRSLALAEQWNAAAADIRSLSACIHVAAGRRDEARALLASLDDDGVKQRVTAFQRAIVHVAFGEHERALTLLEQACAERSKQVRLLRTEPMLDPLRNEPRFHALLRQVGLSDQDVARALAS